MQGTFSSIPKKQLQEAVKMDDAAVDLLLQRMEMHDVVGNNQDYLGNGLTEDNIVNSGNNFGVVETFNIDRTKVTLKKLDAAGAISIIKVNSI